MNESASPPPSQSRARLSTQSLTVPDTQTRPQRGWRLSEQALPAAADVCTRHITDATIDDTPM